MEVQEIPLVFSCGQTSLIGVLHLPQNARKVGLLTVVAGGPQYRAGVARQLVTLGRGLANSGIPVMRFDHSGLGDSVGQFRGFEHLEGDLQAAISTFFEHVPGLESIVLWGGCDAASGIMINAWRFPEVSGVILGNPFVSSAETKAAVTRQHYRSRLLQKEFWLKVFTFKYNPLDYIGNYLRSGGSPKNRAATGEGRDGDGHESLPFQKRMLHGLQKYTGEVLFLMSGRSLVSKEFDELVKRESEWQEALARVPHKRVDLTDADQAFSTENARNAIIAEARAWLLQRT